MKYYKVFLCHRGAVVRRKAMERQLYDRFSTETYVEFWQLPDLWQVAASAGPSVMLCVTQYEFKDVPFLS